jgi:hypothetical protein
MAGMARALVLDFQRHGRENGGQFLMDIGGYAHGLEHLPAARNVKQYVSLSFTLSNP